MHDDLVIPASYEVWLTELKHHLDRTPGSKAALARHLVSVRGIKEKAAFVALLKILRGDSRPGVDVFFDLAIWLQAQTSGDTRTARIEPTDDAPPRREVRYTTGASRRTTRVAEHRSQNTP